MDRAHRMWLLHHAEETAAAECAVWSALTDHVGGTLVAWHRGAAAYRLAAARAALTEQLAVAHLARAAAVMSEPAVQLGESFRRVAPAAVAAAGAVFRPLPASKMIVRAGERPARVEETPW